MDAALGRGFGPGEVSTSCGAPFRRLRIKSLVSTSLASMSWSSRHLGPRPRPSPSDLARCPKYVSTHFGQTPTGGTDGRHDARARDVGRRRHGGGPARQVLENENLRENKNSFLKKSRDCANEAPPTHPQAGDWSSVDPVGVALVVGATCLSRAASDGDIYI